MPTRSIRPTNLDYDPGTRGFPLHPVFEGERVFLACYVSANPQPEDFIWWEKNGTRLGHSHYDEGRLYMNKQINKDDAGFYKCVADNGIGEERVESQELPLIVECK